MKTFKKLFTILTIVLVAIMAFVPAKSLAADDDGKLTITVEGDVAGRTLSVYKLFDLTVTGTTENQVYNYDWATGSKDFFAQLTDGKGNNLGLTTVAKATDYLKGFANNSTQLTKIAEDFYTYCKANNIAAAVPSTTVAADATSVELKVDDQGYYLIYDETTSLGEGRAISAGMLQNVTTNTEVTIKADTTTVDKEAGKTTAFVGENVPFTVTTKVPNLTGYETYTFTVIDTMSKGLDFQNDVVVKIGGVIYPEKVGEGENEITQYTVPQPSKDSNGNTTITIVFTPTEFVKLKSGADIEITYSANLNSGAAVELDNTNDVKIIYSNDPKGTGTGTMTPPHIVHVYTYKIDFTKKNTAGTVLPGAEFILKLSDGKYAIFDTNGVYTGSVAKREDATPLKSNKDGKIAVSGLKAGSYTLIETKAPEGYGIPNFEFTFTISQTLKADGTLESASFDYTADVNNTAANGYMKDQTSTSASFVVEVLNAKEGALPTTGGIGTTIFTVVGIAVMAVAVVALVARNRKND